MNRRSFLAAGAATATLASTKLSVAGVSPLRTRWNVRTSEGFDAICFLNPLAGDDFYTAYYGAEIAAFKPRLKLETIQSLENLFKLVQSKGALLGPNLCVFLSGGRDETLDDLLTALSNPEKYLLPNFRSSPYWDEEGWGFFMEFHGQIAAMFEDMKHAGFADFRAQYLAPRAQKKIPALTQKLAHCDTIAEQERLLGRKFPDPSFEIILLYFSKPHGIKIQGQRFLTHVDYPDEIVIRNADHEMLHPPFDMDGPVAASLLAAMNQDPLLVKIVTEHDKRFGYNSMQGILNEDTVQALEQIVNERLGVADAPAARWMESDDGMHVFAAGLYGLLKDAGYDRTGGNIEHWMAKALSAGLLAPASLHAAAAKVLQRPADALWPLPQP